MERKRWLISQKVRVALAATLFLSPLICTVVPRDTPLPPNQTPVSLHTENINPPIELYKQIGPLYHPQRRK